jgi:hypothetical protein
LETAPNEKALPGAFSLVIYTIRIRILSKNLRFRILQHTVLARVERTRKEAGTLTDTTRNGG